MSEDLTLVSNSRLSGALYNWAFAMGLGGTGYPGALREAARRIKPHPTRKVGVAKGKERATQPYRYDGVLYCMMHAPNGSARLSDGVYNSDGSPLCSVCGVALRRTRNEVE